jgi:di/tricarboxylate transporter
VPSVKYVLCAVAVLIGCWLASQVYDELTGDGNVSIKERLRGLGGRIHSAVGIVAVVILLILLVRLVVQAIKWR